MTATQNNAARIGRSFVLLQAAFFSTMFLTDSLFAEMLSSFGYSDSFIGVTLMLIGISCLALQPLVGMICDKTRNFRAVFFCVFAALSIALPFFFRLRDNATVVIVFSAVFLAATKPIYTVIDSWISKLQKEVLLDYGRLRSFGSVSYAIAAAGLAPIVGRLGYASCTYMVWIAFAVMCIAIFRLPNPSVLADERSVTIREAASTLFGNRNYVILLVCGFLVGIPYQATLLFTSRYISSLGGGVTEIGLSSVVMAASEFLVIKNYSKIADRFGSAATFGFGMLCTAGRMLLFAMAPNATVGILLFVSQALSYAILIPGAVRYIGELVPRSYIATAMLIYQTLGPSIAQIVGSPIFGMLSEKYSVKTMFALTSIPGFIGGIIFLLLCRNVGRTVKPPEAIPAADAE